MFDSQITIHKLPFKVLLLLVFCLALPAAVFAQQPDTTQQGTISDVIIEFVQPTVQSAGNVTTISMPQIKAQQGNGSVNNLLEMMPSTTTTSDAGTGLGATYMSIRGIDQTRINTTLNGVTINNPESHGSWLVNLPDMGAYIGQVSVQNGSNAIDGSTLFSTRIDFQTKDIPETPFAEARSAYGSFNTFHNMVSAGTGLIGRRFSMLASFSDIRSDGYVDYSGVKLNSGFLSAQCRLWDKEYFYKDYGTLKFTMLFGRENSGLAWNGVPYDSLATNRTYNPCGEYYTEDGQRRYYEESKDHYTQIYYQLEYEKKWHNSDYTKRHEIHVMPYLTRGYGYYEQYKDNKKITNFGLEPLYDSIKKTDFITQKWMDNYFYGLRANYIGSIIFGTNARQQLKWVVGLDNNNYNGLHYGKVIWSQPNRVQDYPCDYQWYNGTGDKMQTKVFGGLNYWYKNFSVTAELQYRHINYLIGGTDDDRMDVTQQYKWDFVNPRIVLHYILQGPTLRHSFDLAFTTANNDPTRDDLTAAPDDRKPVPETLYNLEFSYLLYNDKFFLNTTLYGMNYKNQLVRTGELDKTGDALMTNVEKSFRAGIELSAGYKPVRFFTWHINGCFSINRIIDYVNYIDDWDNGGQIVQHLGNTPISFSPSVVLGNDFTFTPLKDFNISLVTKFVSKQYMDNSGDDTYCLKPYSYTNLRLSYTFHFKLLTDLELFVNVNNIFNAKFESNAWIYTYSYGGVKGYETGYFPQAGINAMGGVRLKFL